MDLYLQIGALMEKHGLTNQAMTNLTGIPLGTVSGIRSGKIQSPSFENICAMMKAMNESVDALVGIVPQTETHDCKTAESLDMRERVWEQTAKIAAQTATLEAREENIADSHKRIGQLEGSLAREHKRANRMQNALVVLVIAFFILAAVYIWDVRNLHVGLTAYFNS